MKKLIAVLLAIAVICTSSNVEPVKAAGRLNLIIVIWDGTQRAHLQEMLEAGQLPNLARLIRRHGLGLVRIDSWGRECRGGDGYRTQTGPANPAIVTGLGYPGMRNYENSDPHPIPDGRTLFESLKRKGYATGLVSTKAARFWPYVPLTNARPEIDFWRARYAKQDWVLLRTKAFIRRFGSQSFFLWMHNQQPDHEGHKHGENSDEYSQGLIDDDKQLGRLLRFLKRRGLRRRTLVVITTDHGFVEDGRTHGPCVPATKRVWLVVNKRPGILNCATTQTDIRRCLESRL